MTCAGELCLYWTGQGCICEVLGLDVVLGERTCATCGSTITGRTCIEGCEGS